MKTQWNLICLLVVAAFSASCGSKAPEVSLAEVRAIAKEAYIYGFPMVDNYRIMHAYFVDPTNREYKDDWNHVASEARVYTPADKAIQTPNSDTPYSFVGADLRAEPLVLTVPPVDKGRYYSLQFIDLYTFNFAYAGSRTTGNDGGTYLLAGPQWKGEKPAGVDDVIRCETDFALVAYRTQLFGDKDIEKVKAIQHGYKVQPLSRFLGQSPEPVAPAIEFYPPLNASDERKSLAFFNELNFLLQFSPAHPSEAELMARFAKIGVGAGMHFEETQLSPEWKKAIEDGRADAWAAFDSLDHLMKSGELTSAVLFGTREYLGNDYLRRMAGAVLGIYGNSKEEAVYPVLALDSDGQPLDGAKSRYTIRFAPGQLPPVNAFWSVTMYDAKTKLLVTNPIERYLINSPMLPKLKKEKDGSIVLYLQYASPGPGKQGNWLPAPAGPFIAVMRLYWPKPEAFDGTWKAPMVEKTS